VAWMMLGRGLREEKRDGAKAVTGQSRCHEAHQKFIQLVDKVADIQHQYIIIIFQHFELFINYLTF
jgi:hypothetical protein